MIKLSVTAATIALSPNGSSNTAYSATPTTLTNTVTDYTTTAFTGAQYTAAATADGNNVVTTGTGITTTYVDDVFSAYTYTGNGGTQTINNGIDLAGQGGMVWIKSRDAAHDYNLFDTVRDHTHAIQSSMTSAQKTASSTSKDLSSFNSNGFSLGPVDTVYVNNSPEQYVSWTFRQAPKFFKQVQVTHTSGTPDTVDLSTLGQVGMVVAKRTDSTSDWFTWHRSQTSGKLTYLDLTSGETADTTLSVSGTNLTVASATPTGTYIVYAWAHDPDTTGGIIQAGSYTGVGSGVDQYINLGWEPQFLMVKKIDGASNWVMMDSSRGFLADNGGSSPGRGYLLANTS